MPRCQTNHRCKHSIRKKVTQMQLKQFTSPRCAQKPCMQTFGTWIQYDIIGRGILGGLRVLHFWKRVERKFFARRRRRLPWLAPAWFSLKLTTPSLVEGCHPFTGGTGLNVAIPDAHPGTQKKKITCEACGRFPILRHEIWTQKKASAKMKVCEIKVKNLDLHVLSIFVFVLSFQSLHAKHRP